MLRLLWLGATGAAGALSRYGIGVAFGTRSFPWATLGINILGSFFLGVLLLLAPSEGGRTT
ncbi:MAG TPA: CrcB family protein [Acidimicrobiales bacterium]|nr:CrcB family protein [Acidimicrobiales bacterium]